MISAANVKGYLAAAGRNGQFVTPTLQAMIGAQRAREIEMMRSKRNDFA